jgi:hypothetical protein
LRVLTRRQLFVLLAGEFHEALDHDGPRRHVDAQSKRFRGEDCLDETSGEELFDDLLERRDHPRVVRCDPAPQALQPLAEAEDVELVERQVCHLRLGVLDDRVAFLRRCQPDVLAQTLTHRFVTALAREDEVDRGKHVLAPETVHHLAAERDAGAFVVRPTSAATGTFRPALPAPIELGSARVRQHVPVRFLHEHGE